MTIKFETNETNNRDFQQINSEICINMTLETWKEFCEATSIHGLHYIYGNDQGRKRHPFIWASILFLMTALTVYQCREQLNLYLKFETKVTITSKVMNELEFPAITFCNENTFRKAVVGAKDSFIYIMSALTQIGDQNDLEISANQNRNTCYVPNREQVDILTTTTEINSWMKKGISELLQFCASNSYTTVEKCWWNNEEINCDGIFGNHGDTLGSCFTFNFATSLIKNGNFDAQGNSVFAFGINTTNYQSKILTSAGATNGFRLLLNVHQNDNCGLFKKWYGAGIRTHIHDSSTITSYFVDRPVYLTPGFDVSISIKPVVIHRNTEHLGICKKFIYLYLNPNATTYSHNVCYIQCGTEFVFKHCHCFPPYGDQFTKSAALALNIETKYIKICSANDLSCIKNLEPEMWKLNYEQSCGYCKQPCDEKQYDYQLTTLRLPSADRFVSIYGDEYRNVNDTEIAKNFIQVNFYFETMQSTFIDETQLITTLDLITYVGGIIGLFLGMSFVSIVEIIYQFTYSLYAYFLRQKSKVKIFNKQNRVQTIKKCKKKSKKLTNVQRQREASLINKYSTNLRRMTYAVFDDLFKTKRTAVRKIRK